MSLSLISSVLWVPKGASAAHPRRYDLSDPSELERVERLGKIKLEDARRELEELENCVNGMAVDQSDDGNEWESDSQSESSSNDENDNDQHNPEDKARKMAATIKSGVTNDNNEEDDMKKYNLDSYDTEVSQSKSNPNLLTYSRSMLSKLGLQVWAYSATSKGCRTTPATRVQRMRTPTSLWKMQTTRTRPWRRRN